MPWKNRRAEREAKSAYRDLEVRSNRPRYCAQCLAKGVSRESQDRMRKHLLAWSV